MGRLARRAPARARAGRRLTRDGRADAKRDGGEDPLSFAMLHQVLGPKPLERLLRIMIGCVLIYAGFLKLKDPYSFLDAVYAYELVSPTLGLLIASILPVLELLLGLNLILDLLALGSILLATGLFSLFTLVQAAAIARGLDISCGCFDTSASHASVDYFSLLRTVVILAAAVLAYVRCERAPAV